MIKPAEQKKAAKAFAAEWARDCKEDGNTAPFWLSLLRDVYGVEHPEQVISFEDTVKHEEKGNSLFVDAWIPSMRVIIEQKNADAPLDKKYPRHGRMLTPYEQAFEYDQTQPVDRRARYIVACNFHEFWIYDMNEPEAFRKAIKLKLSDLPDHYDQLNFLVNTNYKPTDMEEVKVSVKAGELVGKLYDAFVQVYREYQPADYTAEDKKKDMHDLNVLCVRIVFCLYAEDSGLFGAPDAFRHYLGTWKIENTKEALEKLFAVLDTKIEERPRFLDSKLSSFPYVNGGLFHDDTIEIPPINKEIYDIIYEDMSKGFDWSAISPTIFGAVFESTLNPETRRSGGMHYTSIENIHKVIDPLFLDDLKKEFNTLVSIPDSEKFSTRRKETALKWEYRQKLEDFQNKLASLTFLDPACGSGNFLTETFICLRRLENRVIRELTGGQGFLDLYNPIKVSIKQFYGIEINDFAVTVAKTALWIAESQMMQETEDIIVREINFLPLKTNAYIHEGNALHMDWNDVIPASKISYVMGNPPFRGYSLQSRKQKEDILSIYKDENGQTYKAAGKIDYVAGWYFKAAQYMTHTAIKAAFVSTNSITQGEQAAAVWKPIVERFGTHIDFAWRTFIWSSEASDNAAVHCVIVGFSDTLSLGDKIIFDGNGMKRVANISPYLTDSPTVFISARNKPIAADVPFMTNGGKPAEGGNLILTAEEKENLLKKEPQAEPLIRPFMMGYDFIHRKPRYCLWLAGASPLALRKCPEVLMRIEKVREYRLQSKKAATRRKAETPQLFDEIKQSNTSYIALPKVSSENRRYIPMDYLHPDVIAGDQLFMILDANLYHFGILESNVHMAWTRTVCGRLKSDYRYSNTVVYNNFPWPNPTPAQKARIEKSAQGILDARKLYPDASLADLYDPLTMPPELRRAHQENDKAVMEAYGFNWHTMTEPECVAELMKMYQKLTKAEEGKK